METAIWIVVGLLTLAGLYWSLFHDRARGRRRCPKCWYDLRASTTLTCSECGFTARHESRLFKTRRRWQPAIAIIFAAILAVGFRFRTPLIDLAAPYLPSTALILLLPYAGGAAVSEALYDRIMDVNYPIVQRPDRRALWCWQWELLAHRSHELTWSASSLDYIAKTYSNPVSSTIAPLTADEILPYLGEESWQTIDQLFVRLGIPTRGPATTAMLPWNPQRLDLKDALGRHYSLFVFDIEGDFRLVAFRQDGSMLHLAGWMDVIDFGVFGPGFEPLPMIGGMLAFRVAAANPGGDGDYRIVTAWCCIDDDNIRVVHSFWSEFENDSMTDGFGFGGDSDVLDDSLDSPNPSIDIRFEVQYYSDDQWATAVIAVMGANPPKYSPGPFFALKGNVQFRWNDTAKTFLPVADESTWKGSDPNTLFDMTSDDFLRRNFNALVEAALGNDPVQATSIRVAVKQFKDSPQKHRFIREINRCAGKTLINEH